MDFLNFLYYQLWWNRRVFVYMLEEKQLCRRKSQFPPSIQSRDFPRYKVSEWVLMIKKSLHLIFVLQGYVSMEPLEEEDFLLVICTCYWAFNNTLVYLVLIFDNKSSCNLGKFTAILVTEILKVFRDFVPRSPAVKLAMLLHSGASPHSLNVKTQSSI